MGKKIGIDLGTTYSCVSCVDDTGVTRIIDPAEGGGYATPSVVYFDPDINDVVIGEIARQEGYLHPESMVEHVKYYMGDPGYILTINSQAYSIVEIFSLILKKLIMDAEDWLEGEDIDGAVITCPSYFGDAAREAIRVAGENVVLSNGRNLKVLQILDEPVAAAIAYGDSRHENMQKTVLIYDLGGATFDLTVMKLNFVGNNRDIDIMAIDGNHMLGGKDWDAALSDYVRNKFCELTGLDADEMLSDPTQIQWFSENIEKTKIMLTKKESAVLIPSFNGNKEKIEITREIFDTETEHLLNQTIQHIDDMMDKNGLSITKDIDEIILVGGSTRMPQVERRLQMEYNKLITSYEPDKAVAMGAAIVAKGLKMDTSQRKVISQKLNHSIGIKIFCDGEWKILNLLYKGMNIPARASTKEVVYLSLGLDNKDFKKIAFEVFQNDFSEQWIDMNDLLCHEFKYATIEFSQNEFVKNNEFLSLTLSMDYSESHSNEAILSLTLFDDIGRTLLSTSQIKLKKYAFLSNILATN